MQKHVADQKIIKAAEEQKEMEEDDRIRAHFKAKQRVATMMKEKEAEMRRQVQSLRIKCIKHKYYTVVTFKFFKLMI